MYSVAIIGCGSIGADKENNIDYPNVTEALTHAHAFFNTKFQIHFVDPDIEKTNRAMKKFYTPNNIAWNSTQTFFKKAKIDVAVISAPTEFHKELAMNVLNCNPKIVIVEKPFCKNLKEATAIAEIYKQAKIPLLVNFTRRFVPEFWNLKHELEHQTIYWATIKYTRGFIREACHALDLCNLLFGWCQGGHLLNVSDTVLINDYSKDDPTYSARFEYTECPIVMLLPSDGRNFGIFEMEICTNKGIYEILHNGELIYKRELQNSSYGHYKTISPYNNTIQLVFLKKALLNMVNEVCAYLYTGSKEFSCTAQHAIEVHQIYDHLACNNI